MKKKLIFSILITLIALLQTKPVIAVDIRQNDTTAIDFHKTELNTGFIFSIFPEREELITNRSRDYQESVTGTLNFRVKRKEWTYLPYLQEYWDCSFEAGLFGADGNFIDSSASEVIRADHRFFGINGKASGSYSGRYYYDRRNFTLVSLNIWSQYDLYKKDASGTKIDSNLFAGSYSKVTGESEFRIGFQAKAGWGTGRLDNINHLVTAERFLEKYYPQRLFSKSEITMLAREIGRIKGQRSILQAHSFEKEVEQMISFLSHKLLLESPTGAIGFWKFSEFSPRFNGTRFGIGPFFNYLNYEPDFIYGGYMEFMNEKYCGVKWNRSISGEISYNRYKKMDWLMLETLLGWSYYPGIKSEYSFGIRYIPGVEVQSIEKFGPWGHSFIPYIRYFSQINHRSRIDLTMSWRIASNDRFMLPGPEMSINIYRSRY